jgi:hypothetical protein
MAPVNAMSVFVEWLTSPATILTVVGPSALFALGLAMVPAWRAMSARLCLLALLSVPASCLVSVWSDTGLVVMPVAALPICWMALRDGLLIRKNLFPVLVAMWVGVLLPDALCSYRDFGVEHWARAWYIGFGGWGIEDDLLVLPVSLTGVLLLGQEALHCSWPNPPKWFSGRGAA